MPAFPHLSARPALVVAVTAAAGVCAVSLMVATAASAADHGKEGDSPARDPRSTVNSCSGGAAKKIAPGDCLVVTVHGFDPAERVVARLLSNPDKRVTLASDTTGTVQWRYVVAPAVRGKDVATFVGQGAAHNVASGGSVVVTVPRIGVVRYTLSDAHGKKDNHGKDDSDRGADGTDQN